MCRLTRMATSSGRIRACRLACAPTTTSVGESKSTTDGVVCCESALMMMAGRPYSSTCAMHEYVVPRSMPKTLLATENLHAREHQYRSAAMVSAGQPVHFNFSDAYDRPVSADETRLDRGCDGAVGGRVGGSDPLRTSVMRCVELLAGGRGKRLHGTGQLQDLQQLGVQHPDRAGQVVQSAQANHLIMQLDHAGDDWIERGSDFAGAKPGDVVVQAADQIGIADRRRASSAVASAIPPTRSPRADNAVWMPSAASASTDSDAYDRPVSADETRLD